MSLSKVIRAGDGDLEVAAWRVTEVAHAGGPGSFRRSADVDVSDIRQRAWNQGFEQGHAEGHAAGHAAGLEAGTRELAERIAAVEKILDALARPLEDLDHRVEAEILALVQAITRQLIRREMRQDPGHLVGIIREGLAALPLAAGDVVVRLHPADAAAIRERLADPTGDRAWRIESDPLLEQGGCLITTPRSTIDARLDARLARVVAGMLEDERSDDEG